MLHNLQVEDYVYGDEDTSFFHTVTTALFAGYVCMYIALGQYNLLLVLCLCVCSFIIGLSITLTATQLITERKEGVIDRTWVAGGLDITSCDLTWSHPIAGVTVTEIIISQTFSFFFMAVAQSLPLFFVITYAYDVSLVIILAYSTTFFCYSSLEKAALC